MAAKRRKTSKTSSAPNRKSDQANSQPKPETPFDEQTSAPVQPKIPVNKYPLIKRPVGRPSEYSDYTANMLCARLTNGESLRTICRDEDMPGVVTVFSWMRRYPEFEKLYTRALQHRVETHVEEIIEIADDGTNDFVEKVRDDGSTYIVADHEHIQRSRLRVDTRKWIASKLKPRKYGEKITQEHSGPDGKPIEIKARNELVDRVMELMLERAAPKTIENPKT